MISYTAFLAVVSLLSQASSAAPAWVLLRWKERRWREGAGRGSSSARRQCCERRARRRILPAVTPAAGSVTVTGSEAGQGQAGTGDM